MESERPDKYFALGYGRGIAETFAQHGAKVLVLDIDEEGARQSGKFLSLALRQEVSALTFLTFFRSTELITQAGYLADYVVADVTSSGDWEMVRALAKQKYGKIDIMVNNAGWTYRRKDSLIVTEQEFDRK